MQRSDCLKSLNTKTKKRPGY